MKKIIKIVAVLLAICAIILIVNAFMNSKIKISKYELNYNNLPEDFEDYKIAQLTDIHSIRNEKQTNKIIDSVKSQKPNVIFITGDLIDAPYYKKELKKENIEEKTIEFISKLRKIAPIYYVYGNHEYILEDTQDTSFKDSLKELGINLLMNESVYLFKSNDYIKLIGLTDPYVLKFMEDTKEIEGNNAEKTRVILNKISEDNGEDCFTILLAHRPELIDVYSEYGVDLAFSGHAHGGIVRLPFLGGIYAHPQGLFPKYDLGEYESGEMTLILSSGIGKSREWVRLFNPPEVVLVKLINK